MLFFVLVLELDNDQSTVEINVVIFTLNRPLCTHFYENESYMILPPKND